MHLNYNNNMYIIFYFDPYLYINLRTKFICIIISADLHTRYYHQSSLCITIKKQIAEIYHKVTVFFHLVIDGKIINPSRLKIYTLNTRIQEELNSIFPNK